MTKSNARSNWCNFAGLFVLAVAAFAIGTAEFVTTGLLPNLARTFHVSIPVAAYVTSGYALGIVIGGPLLTALTIHMNRKLVLVGIMALFAIGCIVSATAYDFDLLIAGRVISGLSQGVFFGVSAVVAGSFVAPNKKAMAISLMFTGLTLANVIGVPFGTLLGHHFGWRIVLWIVAGFSLLGLIGILSFVPKKVKLEDTHLKRELKVFKRPQVWASYLVTIFGFGGLLACFAYIAPLMTHVAGFSEGSVAWLMMVFGAGLVIGNIVGGKLADKSLSATLYGMLVALIVVLVVFTYTVHYTIPALITLFALGIVGFGVIPALQMQVMKYAEGAPTLASAGNIAAFNLGVTISVYLAGLSIHAGYGFDSINWVGAGMSTFGLVIAVVGGIIWKCRL